MSSISQILEDSGIIHNARVFKYYVNLKMNQGLWLGNMS